jgi:hypothetical protein
MAGLRNRLRDWFASRRRAPRVSRGVEALEARELLYFAFTSYVVIPQVLKPPNGRMVPVEIAGTLAEYSINAKNQAVYQELPGPQRANIRVVDDYRIDEPAVNVPLQDQGGGKFRFDATIRLQASVSQHLAQDRHYYATFAVTDLNGGTGKVFPVIVPFGPTAPVHQTQTAKSAPRHKGKPALPPVNVPTNGSSKNPFAGLFGR